MEENTEVADYVNAPEGPADKKATGPEDTNTEAAPEGTVGKKASPPGLRFVLLIAVCWIILLAIMGLRIYFTSELSEDSAKQTAEILKLTAGVQELNKLNQELNKLNQELETQKNNLTQQIQNMETNWNELNISRAQWSIDSYCLGNTDDKCQPCQFGWFHTEPSCYSINEPPWITWEEAQEDCKGKNSDLTVAHKPSETSVIILNTFSSFGAYGFWIGLRVEDGEWKWVDGSDLADSSFIAAPVDGQCAISVLSNNKWLSVSCDKPQRWICQKKALSVAI